MLRLVADLLRLMDSDLEPQILNQASNEIPKQYLDCAKARRMLDWTPRFRLDEGLTEAIGWYRDWLAGSSS